MNFGEGGRPWRLLDRYLPWLLGLAVFAVSLESARGSLGVTSTVPMPVLVAVSAAAGVTTVLARRWVWPLLVVAAVAYVWLVMWPAAVVASYYAGVQLRKRLYLFVGGATAIFLLSVWISNEYGGQRGIVIGTPANATLMALATVGLPLLAGLWVRARRQVVDGMRERAERLQREQVMRAEQARTQERARIAREMHDVVAHRVSLMVLHAGALEVSAPDERTEEAAALIAGIGREALTNLRDVLGVLRSPRKDELLSPQPTLADLDRLLDQSRSLGISVTRRDEGYRRAMGENAERAAYRVVQEALTNVHKHASKADAELFLRFQPGQVEVEVRNQRPESSGERLPSSGWGLVGLRERVELLGGTLDTGPTADGGFRVLARIPL